MSQPTRFVPWTVVSATFLSCWLQQKTLNMVEKNTFSGFSWHYINQTYNRVCSSSSLISWNALRLTSSNLFLVFFLRFSASLANSQSLWPEDFPRRECFQFSSSCFHTLYISSEWIFRVEYDLSSPPVVSTKCTFFHSEHYYTRHLRFNSQRNLRWRSNHTLLYHVRRKLKPYKCSSKFFKGIILSDGKYYSIAVNSSPQRPQSIFYTYRVDINQLYITSQLQTSWLFSRIFCSPWHNAFTIVLPPFSRVFQSWHVNQDAQNSSRRKNYNLGPRFRLKEQRPILEK